MRKKLKARYVNRRYIKKVIGETTKVFHEETREVADCLLANREVLRDEVKEIKSMGKEIFDLMSKDKLEDEIL